MGFIRLSLDVQLIKFATLAGVYQKFICDQTSFDLYQWKMGACFSRPRSLELLHLECRVLGSKMKNKGVVLTLAEKSKNILASNWQGQLNTIKADAQGSKNEIHSSKVKYLFKRGKPYIWIPEDDMHNTTDALMLPLDHRGFDVLGKAPKVTSKDGSQEYVWREYRFTFKEEARDIETFCHLLVEMEEEALKKIFAKRLKTEQTILHAWIIAIPVAPFLCPKSELPSKSLQLPLVRLFFNTQLGDSCKIATEWMVTWSSICNPPDLIQVCRRERYTSSTNFMFNRGDLVLDL